MNQTLASFCLDAIDKAFSSPIGNAIKFNYESLPFIPSDDINIFLLSDRLIDRNYYDSPESFIIDLQNIIGQACRFFGEQSDLSIALLSFQYSVKKNLQPVLELRSNNSEHGFSEKDLKFKKSRNTLLDKLTNYLDKIPNDISSYKIFTETIQKPPYVDNEDYEKYPNPDINIDFLELKSKIERIDQDRDVSELMDIIEHYQPELSNIVGNVKFDLKLCHPHTLYLINEHVKKCKLRPLPSFNSGYDRIQRSQSVPVKKSSSSSMIILPNPLHNKSYEQQQELQQQVQDQQQQIQNQTNKSIENNNDNDTFQPLNQQQTLQMQLKNINSFNYKNSSRSNISISPSSSSSYISPSSSQMMSNITVQPSTLPQPSQSSQLNQSPQRQKPKRQTKQYKNQFSNDISNNSQNNIQLLQMQMLQQQQQIQQNLGSDPNQFPPYLKEALSIARMNNFMMMNDLKKGSSDNQQQTVNSAPQTPSSTQNSFISTSPNNIAAPSSFQLQQQSFTSNLSSPTFTTSNLPTATFIQQSINQNNFGAERLISENSSLHQTQVEKKDDINDSKIDANGDENKQEQIQNDEAPINENRNLNQKDD